MSMYSSRMLLQTFFDIHAYLLVHGPQFKINWLRKLEKLLYLCISWFWILLMASDYQLYMYLNSTLFLQLFYSSGSDFTWWGIKSYKMVYPPDSLVWGIVYFVTPALNVSVFGMDHWYYMCFEFRGSSIVSSLWRTYIWMKLLWITMWLSCESSMIFCWYSKTSLYRTSRDRR